MCERSHWDQTDGKGLSIFKPSVAMAYDRLKHVMRLKFRRSNFVPQVYLYSEEFYNLAWHVRVGDITLHADNIVMFQNIAAQVGKVCECGYGVSAISPFTPPLPPFYPFDVYIEPPPPHTTHTYTPLPSPLSPFLRTCCAPRTACKTAGGL